MYNKGLRKNIDKDEKLDPLVKQRLEIIREIMSKYKNLVYVDPITFKGLVDNKNIKVVNFDYVENKLGRSDLRFIHTNHVKAPHFDGQYIEVDEKTSKLIKHLEWAFLDKLFAGITEAPYNKRTGKLKIEEAEFEFDIDQEPAKICNLLFGSAQYIKRKRDWNEIEEKILDRSKDRDKENAMKMKVFRINERISKKLGYPDLIIFENKTLYVNPDYYYIFKTSPTMTK